MVSKEIIISAEIIFCLAVGIFSYSRKSISTSGFIALVFICAIFIYLQDASYLAILFAMFASSSLLSKYKASVKRDMEAVVAKSGPRDAYQAIANLGIAVCCYLAYYFTENPGFIYAFLGSVAASNADSWASEIGGLSKKTPLMITTLKPIRKGLSGGVTLLGTLGGIAGALVISALGAIAIQQEVHAFSLFSISLIAGILGFMFDSYLGALFQAKYLEITTQELTEVQSEYLVKGWSWMNNDWVNFLSTLFGAGCAYVLYLVA